MSSRDASWITPPNESRYSWAARGAGAGCMRTYLNFNLSALPALGASGAAGGVGVSVETGTAGSEKLHDLQLFAAGGVGGFGGSGIDVSTWPLNDDTVTLTGCAWSTPTYTLPLCEESEYR